MLIKALNEYYDILSEAGKVCPDGFSTQKVHYMIMLRKDGTISGIVDVTESDLEGKKKNIPLEIILPKRNSIPKINSEIIEHRPLYIFGLNYDKKSGKYSAEDEKNRAKKSHEAFVKTNLEYTEGMTSDIVIAYRNFIKNWKPEDETNNEYLLKIGSKYSASNFCFALDGHTEITLHDMDGDICSKIKNEINSKQEEKSTQICAITGKRGEIAKIHDKISGLKGAQASGASMVCFNNKAEESYGKSQSYNSSVSQDTMRRYTEALNILISDSHHRMYMDDMTVVFWAMSFNDAKEINMFSLMFNPSKDQLDAGETEMVLKKAVEAMGIGKTVDLSSIDIDENVEFYVVGLTPNTSRISQKFLYHDKFGKIFGNVALHQADMFIDGSKGNIPLWRIMKEIKSPKSTNEKTPPPLISAVFQAALSGGKYPESLLETAVRRVKTDKSVNYVRAGIIKACINRKSRIYKNKEELKLALDIENNDQAYLCGRLFAMLERIQNNASTSELNRTIKDSYFSSACAKPADIFPRLMKLAQYHLKKDDYGIIDNKIVGEIMEKLGDEFPQTLSLNDQGKFIIGYYHQYQSFFKKRDKKD
ncbi:MAG: type I-C CRISPR-associated protein Cas8c/Csd1 [Monoglobales bacterium]